MRLIMLVGANTLPNYIAAHMVPNYSTLTFIYSEATEDQKEFLIETINRPTTPGIRLRSPYNEYEILMELQEQAARDGGDNENVHLHYTSGTAAMTNAAIEFYQREGLLAATSYIDGHNGYFLTYSYENGNMTSVHKAAINAPISNQSAVNLTPELLCRLHGLTYVGSQSEHEDVVTLKTSISESIIQASCHDSFVPQKLVILCSKWRDDAENNLSSLFDGGALSNLKPISTYVQASIRLVSFFGKLIKERSPSDLTNNRQEVPSSLLEIYQSKGVPDAWSSLPPLGESWSGAQSHWVKFFRGVWMEHFLVSVLTRVIVGRDELSGAMIARGVHAQTQKSRENVFEGDVILTKGSRLFLFSCTIEDCDDHILKHKLYEVSLRARQLGGDLARAAIVHLGDTSKSQKLKVAVESLWLATRPGIFGASEVRGWSEGMDCNDPQKFNELTDWLLCKEEQPS